MKIYSLVRTELYNQTELQHFPTMEAAQKQMLEECSKIVGEEITKLHNNYVTKDGMWDVTTADYYATLSNGNKIEFEIFERSVDLKDFVINAIIDKVIEIDPNCKDYREIIADTLDSFGEINLPKMVNSEINHFVETELDTAMACRAADALNIGYDDDDVHSVAFDYLEGNRGFSIMAKIINGEQATIDEIKTDINKVEKREIFKLGNYVWVAKSHTDEGEIFSREEEIKVFDADSYDSALKYMQEEYNTAQTIFLENGYDDIGMRNDGELFQVFCDHDCWEGTLTKVCVEN